MKCCANGCDRRAERNNERCVGHSRAYYAKYWGPASLYYPKGDEYIDYGYFAEMPRKMKRGS
jgi:hypothetical protein